ncbi:hypothetical protein, partial [Pseudomonas sp.]|uniref:hypothetical protein n=1 Tax=Pseudomonas sp. TaxID=306 RepID=UPI003CC6B998
PSALANILFGLYLSRYRLTSMIEALSHSPHIAMRAGTFDSGGLLGRMMLVSKISGMVTLSGLVIRSGELSADDIAHFPSRLMRLAKVKFFLSAISFMWLIGGFLLIE